MFPAIRSNIGEARILTFEVRMIITDTIVTCIMVSILALLHSKLCVQQTGQAKVDSIAAAQTLLEARRAELEATKEELAKVEVELEIKMQRLRALHGQMPQLNRRNARAEGQLAREEQRLGAAMGDDNT